jgi:hypothetical protein
MRNPMSEYPGEWDGYDRGPTCCVGECCGPGSYCCGHPENIHEHTVEEQACAVCGSTGYWVGWSSKYRENRCMNHLDGPDA